MNFYERHIGDSLKRTSHLSLLEHGVYVRLRDVYLDREAAIPEDKAARLIGARTEPETQALQVVLQEFFQLVDGAWVCDECEALIEAYQAGEPEREVKKANEDNRLKRHRQERAALFKVLTDRGEHAPWNIGIEDLRKRVSALQVPGPETTPVTPTATAPATPATATHYPLPTTQSPEEGKSAPPRKRSAAPACPVDKPDDVAEQTWADWLTLRKAKRAPVTETVVANARRESEAARMPLDAFLQVWCTRGSQGLQADWLRPAERQVQSRVSFAEADAQRARERADAWRGRSQRAAPIDITEPGGPALELLP